MLLGQLRFMLPLRSPDLVAADGVEVVLRL
jgi:hypothetical protein